MKKKMIRVICLIGIMSILLTGCCLSHDWQEATCVNPKTCSKCGKTEGEALGHDWQEATCTEAKTCSVCGETEGEPLGHISVGESTCTEAVFCEVCGAIAIEALGHNWKEATCTEAKTCSVCGEIEGEPLGHTWIEATCQQPLTCSVCGITEGEPIEHNIDDTGHCLMCNEEVGIVLTVDNVFNYLPYVSWRDFNEYADIRYYIEKDGQKEYVLSLGASITQKLNPQYLYHDLELTYEVWLEGKPGHVGSQHNYLTDENGNIYDTTAPKVVFTYDDFCKYNGDMYLGEYIKYTVEGLNLQYLQYPNRHYDAQKKEMRNYNYYYILHVDLIGVKGYITSNPNY